MKTRVDQPVKARAGRKKGSKIVQLCTLCQQAGHRSDTCYKKQLDRYNSKKEQQALAKESKEKVQEQIKSLIQTGNDIIKKNDKIIKKMILKPKKIYTFDRNLYRGSDWTSCTSKTPYENHLFKIKMDNKRIHNTYGTAMSEYYKCINKK